MTTSATSGISGRFGCRGWQGQRIVLHFESATHRPPWVNDTEVVSHEGGYTLFEADITDHTPGEQIRITARVNNTLHWQSIPPGVIEETPAGPRQRYWHDFFNYGIHRNVWLYATPPAYIADLTVTTDLDGDNGGLLHRGRGWRRSRGLSRPPRRRRAEIASADGFRGTCRFRTCTSGLPGRLSVRPGTAADQR